MEVSSTTVPLLCVAAGSLLLLVFTTLTFSTHPAEMRFAAELDRINRSTADISFRLRREVLAGERLSRSELDALRQQADFSLQAGITAVSHSRVELMALLDAAHRKITVQILSDFDARVRLPPSTPAPLAQAMNGGSPFIFEPEPPSEAVSELPGGPYAPLPDPLAKQDPAEESARRAEAVKEAFQHSWKGYKQYAFGMDELQTRTMNGKNWNEMDGARNGLGLTVLDSATTMHVMGLSQELEEALEFIHNDLRFDKEIEASVFETTIRMLGSLLSLFELTGERDKKLLSLAVDVADRLLVSFNTSTGLPHSTVSLNSRRHYSQPWSNGNAVLSEFGTVQLELRTLSFHTGNPIYDMKGTHVMSIVESRAPDDMLCPVFMSIRTAEWSSDHVSLGALGDSFYEYVLKQYLLTGKTEVRYKNMFMKLVRGIIEKLVMYSYPSRWAFVSEYRRRELYHKMDHLACFVGGMLALGATEVDDFLHKKQLIDLAGKLTETCVKMYSRQKSGVSPEFVEFPGQQDFVNGNGFYILRPETMESLFYMWRLTKEQKWRDYGWNIFRAIDRFCRVASGGYSGLTDVNVALPVKDNLMQSFWMAETLKYMYLLFAEDTALDLSQWVLNTEAHPLRIRRRDPMDVWRSYEQQHGVAWLAPTIRGVTPIETTRMAQERKARGGIVTAAMDVLGEDAGDGLPDDDAMPFDTVEGMKGLPHVPPSGGESLRERLIDSIFAP
jgi:mannosyl-oligosaccharide alpha-1,2-mannosidase